MPWFSVKEYHQAKSDRVVSAALGGVFTWNPYGARNLVLSFGVLISYLMAYLTLSIHCVPDGIGQMYFTIISLYLFYFFLYQPRLDNQEPFFLFRRLYVLCTHACIYVRMTELFHTSPFPSLAPPRLVLSKKPPISISISVYYLAYHPCSHQTNHQTNHGLLLSTRGSVACNTKETKVKRGGWICRGKFPVGLSHLGTVRN